MTAPDFSRRDITLANWREWPFSRWSFQNVGEFVPTAPVVWGSEDGEDSPGEGALAGLALERSDGSKVSAHRHFEETHGDCFVAMRDGKVIAEWDAAHASSLRPHIIFSITKSVTGMLAGIAAADGVLDVDAPISRYVPVTPGSAYAEARVRHLLDMSVSLDFEEDYLDKSGPFDRYRRAMLWNPEREPSATEAMLDVLSVLPRAARPHGERFYYASPNTDMIGLVLQVATGRRFHDYLAERLWRPMGAKGPAYITLDRIGSARAAGGFCVTARDLARFGQLVLDGGVVDGTRLIPAGWIDDMRKNGDQRAWLAGNFKADFPHGNYRSFWYDAGDGRGSFCGIGIHGQWLWCDPTSNVVLVKFSSRPQPSDDAATHVEISALSQIAQAL